MTEKIPRLVIAGLSGDSGKTIATLSLLAALKRRGLKPAVFKKGPDYIDPAWLSWASDSVCRNLDTYMVNKETVAENFQRHSSNAAISIIEGNRGIFDGMDVDGKHSTAELAKLLRAPVLLVVDCTKTTRTIAAIIKGCIEFDPELNIAGIILNRIAGKRHREVVSDAIREYCNLPVLGAIPRLDDEAGLIPGRHLGLITPSEYEFDGELESGINDIAENYLNIDDILNIANIAETVEIVQSESHRNIKPVVRIGYFKDSVFTFYYPENLESLIENGAELVPISSLSDSTLPDIDGLYIGGGFPETHADRLSENQPLMNSVRSAAESGMPIYAECGGLIYLSKSLKWNDNAYAMAGLFDIDLEMSKKPVGHGYAEAEVDCENPYFPIGSVIRGHEFHYSGPHPDNRSYSTCLSMKRGVGIGEKRDGLLYKNCFASYIHIHADGVPEWAISFIGNVQSFKKAKKKKSAGEYNNLGRSDCLITG